MPHSLAPLRGYQGEDIEIVLPGNLTVYDINWLAVWCVEYRHNFGHVLIPKDLDVPPALGQTKITVNENESARSTDLTRLKLSCLTYVLINVQREMIIHATLCSLIRMKGSRFNRDVLNALYEEEHSHLSLSLPLSLKHTRAVPFNPADALPDLRARVLARSLGF